MPESRALLERLHDHRDEDPRDDIRGAAQLMRESAAGLRRIGARLTEIMRDHRHGLVIESALTYEVFPFAEVEQWVATIEEVAAVTDPDPPSA